MRIRVLGGGWYGSHLSLALIEAGHEVELHETAHQLFAGASGNNPARLHRGFHYPRSRLTRAACQDHEAAFMARYGFLTEGVAENIYAIAAHDSLMDFGTYCQVLRGEVEFVTVDPRTYGLFGVEGAILTGERHIVPNSARNYFTEKLAGHVEYHRAIGKVDDPAWDWTIDCSFCANDAEAIDRYEPCVMALLSGPTHGAVTIMDGPFPSVYPWSNIDQLCSLTSASLTPISKVIRTYDEAQQCLNAQRSADLAKRGEAMLDQMEAFYPEIRSVFRIAEYRMSIRAMPKSAADARLVDVVRVGERALRVRAGKIDAIMTAEKIVREMIGCS